MDARPLIVGIGEILWDLLPGGRQLGGAPANFAYHANALGARGAVVSQVGDDALGREVLDRLDALGLDRSAVSLDPRHPTGTVDVRLDADGVPTYVIHQDVAWDFLPPGGPAADLCTRASAVCFGTLASRSPVSRESVVQLLKATPRDCLRVFDINLRQRYFDKNVICKLLEMSNVVKLNDAELPVLANLFELRGPEPAHQLLERFDLEVLALTRGPSGSRIYTPGGLASDHPGVRGPIDDTVGAGDAFTAALVLGLLGKLRGCDTLDQVNAFANRLASYVCSQPGATPPIPDALRTAGGG